MLFKKLMLSFVVMFATFSMIYAAEANNEKFAEYTKYWKSKMIFNNGKSFLDLENELREKFPEIPEIVIADTFPFKLFAEPTQVDGPFYYGKNTGLKCKFWIKNPDTGQMVEREIGGHVFLMPTHISVMDYEAVRFFMHHEIGHSQMPNNIALQNGLVLGSMLPIAYFWKKMIGSKPYRNRCTKYGSKFVAARVITTAASCALSNLEERRADNFALKHSDDVTCQGGKKGFEHYRDQCYKPSWRNNKFLQYLPFAVAQYFIDPLHPSMDSRIAKIDKHLQQSTLKK